MPALIRAPDWRIGRGSDAGVGVLLAENQVGWWIELAGVEVGRVHGAARAAARGPDCPESGHDDERRAEKILPNDFQRHTDRHKDDKHDQAEVGSHPATSI